MRIRRRPFSVTPIGAEAMSWNGIYDLRVVGEQRPRIVGAVAKPYDVPGFVQHADFPSRAEIAVIPEMVDASTVPNDVRIVRQIEIDQDFRTTIRIKRDADRIGAGTCLEVRRTDPLPCIIKQLHIGHDYVMTAWRTAADDQFIEGLLTLAQENTSEVIVTGIPNLEHMQDAQNADIRYAVCDTGFLCRNPSEPTQEREDHHQKRPTVAENRRAPRG